jgi:fructose-1,6-bisphosphatase
MEITMDKETKIEMLNQLLENLDGAIDETIETFENDFFAEGMDQNDVATFYIYAKERLDLMYLRANERIEDRVICMSKVI